MLHTPPLNIGYCGPTAIAAITGRTKKEIYQAIHEARLDTCGEEAYQARKDGALRRMPVFGLSNDDLMLAMDILGWTLIAHAPPPRGTTLDTFMEALGRMGTYIVNVTGHYIAVSQGEVCDTATRMPIPYASWRNKRGGRHVKHWFNYGIQNDQ